jgi:hypothetical protein
MQVSYQHFEQIIDYDTFKHWTTNYIEYGRRFHAILDRYQDVIRFGIYSHVHQEQYQVIRDMVQ